MSTRHRPAPPFPSRFVANTAQNCDDRVLSPLPRAAPATSALAPARMTRACARAARALARAAGLRGVPGALAGARRAAVRSACVRALPWLRSGLPALRRCRSTAGAVSGGGARRSRGRGRRWPTRASARRLVAALKFRGALRGGRRDGRADGGEPPARCATRRSALVPVPAAARAPARARVRPGARARRARSRAALDRPLAACLVRADRAARQVGASRRERRARRAGWRSACAARRRRWRSSSTTSTRRARRSTPPPARCGRGHARGRGDHLRPHAVSGLSGQRERAGVGTLVVAHRGGRCRRRARRPARAGGRVRPRASRAGGAPSRRVRPRRASAATASGAAARAR